MTKNKYIGTELDLFSRAKNWKSYYKHFISPVLKNDILEVGAGIGSTTLVFADGDWKSWTCLEPDPEMIISLNKIANGLNQQRSKSYQVINGNLSDLSLEMKFDGIIYIDVLEHIEDDKEEIKRAYNHLADDGHLIVLSPAHQFFFSAFDRQIGHFRRYDKKSFREIIPPQLECIRMMYLDSAGSILSLSNRFLLRKNMPTQKQLAFWDNVVIPISKHLDKILNYTVGKSILGIWKK